MSEDLKLFTFSFVARREVGPATDTGIGTGLALVASEGDAEAEATAAAFEALPPGEGWEQHEVLVQEVPQGFEFANGHRLTWQANKPS